MDLSALALIWALLTLLASGSRFSNNQHAADLASQWETQTPSFYTLDKSLIVHNASFLYIKRHRKIFELNRTSDYSYATIKVLHTEVLSSDNEENPLAETVRRMVHLDEENSPFYEAVAQSMKQVCKGDFGARVVRDDMLVTGSVIEVKTRTAALHKFLLPEVRKELMTQSVEHITREIGMFYAVEAHLGGALHVLRLGEVNDDETVNAARARIEDKMSLVKSIKMSNRNQVHKMYIGSSKLYTRWTSWSNNSEWVRFSKGFHRGFGQEDDSRTLPQIFEDMKEVWFEENVEKHPIYVVPTSIKLVPLWTLLDNDEMNRTKAGELKAYLQGQWQAQRKAYWGSMACRLPVALWLHAVVVIVAAL